MKICLEIIESSLIREISRDTEVGLGIYFEHNGICYPDVIWNDFGVRLLSFWLYQLGQMKKKGTGPIEFIFLDGDFALKGQVDSKYMVRLEPINPGHSFIWELSIFEVERAVLDASKFLLKSLEKLAVRPRGIEGVEEGVRHLKLT